jgi:hypothetical protein
MARKSSKGGGVRIEWDGLKEFEQFLKETPGVVVKDVKAALYQEGENAMGVSKQRTPVDTGDLKATGHVKLPIEKGGGVMVELAYGTDYAIYVHEILSASHPTGQAKYLQSAVEEAAPGMGGRLKERVLDRLGGRL